MPNKFCPQCGCLTQHLFEGYCAACCDDNQTKLDAFNAGLDLWERMTDKQKDDAIRRAVI